MLFGGVGLEGMRKGEYMPDPIIISVLVCMSHLRCLEPNSLLV